MKKKIAIILPYKEIYSNKNAGAASIWLKDYNNLSTLSKETIIYGNLDKGIKPISSNFKNINISNTTFSKTKAYINFFYKDYLKYKYEIIEIHNRPEYLNFLINKNVKAKLLFFFHNNPKEIRGSKTLKERLKILENTDNIFFVSDWTKKKFFSDLPFKAKSNVDILYPSIKKVNKFNSKKENQIIFTGKLNSSKGYDIFGIAVLKILNEYQNWKAVVAGNEPREKFNFKHKNLEIHKWLPHNKILELYKKSAISIVPSKWEEPFGRTAMESAAHGCATITSNRGGLIETFDNDLIIENLTSNELFKKIDFLIKNPKKLKYYQFKNFKNPKHIINDLVNFLDSVKYNYLNKKIFINKSIGPKIIHISNFNEKNNQRLFNISIASKLTNGFIRNNCDVINFSYRNYLSSKMFPKFDENIIDISKNYKPDMILLGHTNILKRSTMETFKENNLKIALWYEDHIADYGPNWINNLHLIERNHDLIDQYFVTTHPSVIKTKINKSKLHFLPIPVDENIENLKIYENEYRYKDLFFALSHGVNFGGLRKNSNDEREIFLKKLLEKGKDINFHILGINNDKPKWNYDFYKEMIICKMSLNLSRGKPLKYASSNRIASYMGNGILTFINEKVKYQELFSDKEMVFYKNEIDLIEKINKLKKDTKKINQISKNGRDKYFSIFNNNIISDSIISKVFQTTPKYKYVWEH
jgi:glycosyltransferase involved in cell wall biosynthesis